MRDTLPNVKVARLRRILAEAISRGRCAALEAVAAGVLSSWGHQSPTLAGQPSPLPFKIDLAARGLLCDRDTSLDHLV